MKFIIISIFFGIFLYGSETERVESILKDIEKLRKENSECQAKLSSKVDTKDIENYKKLLLQEKLNNSIYLSKIKKLDKAVSNIESTYKKNEKSNNNKTKLSLDKENEYKKIITKYEEKIKTKDKTIKSLENKISSNDKLKRCEDNNPFPKLVMKDGVETIETFKASSFRLNSDCDIYDSIDGKVVYNWEDKTSFTSSIMTQNWIKITGYFVDKEWQKADEELWVRKINTIKR